MQRLIPLALVACFALIVAGALDPARFALALIGMALLTGTAMWVLAVHSSGPGARPHP
jgi:hypothetical protein